MKEKLTSCASYYDGENLWCYDEVIGTLSKIDLRTFHIECMVTPMQIVSEDEYVVRTLIGWRNKIVVIPIDINRKWVFYDMAKKKVEYDILYQECHRYSKTILIEDTLILFPVSVKHPILIVDLWKRMVVKKLTIEDPEMTVESGMEIWNARKNKNEILFLIQGSRYFGILNHTGIRIVKINILETLMCADFDRDIGWAIDFSGEYLYRFDIDGNILNRYALEEKGVVSKIIIKNNYIFLLPTDGNEVRIFDDKGKLVKKIGAGEENISLGFPELLNLPAYWDYIEGNENICLIPLKYPMQIVNLNNLEVKKKVVEYTEKFSRTKYWEYCRYLRKLRKKVVFLENSSNMYFERYLELIKWSSLEINRCKVRNTEKIWEILKKV